MQALERQAVKQTAEDLGLGVSTIRERWKTMSLPLPFYNALENGEISYSKAKAVSALRFDPDNDKDIECAENILLKIMDNVPTKQIKEIAQQEMNDIGIWNQNDVVMRSLAAQKELIESSPEILDNKA